MSIGLDASRIRIWTRILVAAVLVAALSTVLGFAPPRGFALDDAWIHQTVARVFAKTGVLGFDPALPGSAVTSVLWTTLLALNPAFLHVSPVLFTTVLSAGLFVGAGQIVYSLALADGATPAEAVVSSLAFLASGNVVWFALSGMEVMLVIVLALGAVWAAFHDASARSAALSGTALSLLFLTRPETILLGPLLLVSRRRGVRGSAWLLAPVCITVAAYVAANVVRTGHAFPATFEGRRWLAEVGFAGATRADVVFSLARQWLDRLAEYTLGTPSPLFFYPVLGLALFGGWGFVADRRVRLATVCVWAFVQALAYAAFLPSIGHGGRYQPFVPGVFCLMATWGALRFGRLLFGRFEGSQLGRHAAFVAVVPLFAAMARSLPVWSDANAAAVEHEENTEIAMARMVGTLPRASVVASFDIGAMAYFSERPVEDLGGLVRPDIVPFLREGRTVDWLRKIDASYLVLPLGYRTSVPEPFNFGEILRVFRSPDMRLVPITERGTPLLRWLTGVRATANCAPRQRLYRIEWQRGTL